ncbi:PREDICTED: interleukin-22 [Elephantulus edwardii]|uniref:interleukin-22 n=1 Tax=Elephantulus edwardii TaxID=28737 RepID=UPI0003F06EC3|nr:PREDICTED: interleukin-22 [Elephantulus edwardii]
MAILQKSVSSSLWGSVAACYILLTALSIQGGTAVPIKSHCMLNQTDFQQPYVINRTLMLAKEASLADNNTDVRLIEDKLLSGVHVSEHCYLMKQVLNFTIEDVLLPYSDRFQPHMQQVVSIMTRFRNQLSQCHIQGDGQQVQRNVQKLKDTVKQLGESGEIKVIGEMDLLFFALKDACT